MTADMTAEFDFRPVGMAAALYVTAVQCALATSNAVVAQIVRNVQEAAEGVADRHLRAGLLSAAELVATHHIAVPGLDGARTPAVH